jgi:hypothetical protein
MKQTLLDCGVVPEKVPLLCDNENTVKIANNPVQHSHTKHIDICHHFLRDHVAKNDISLEGVRIEDQLVDIFTKPLDEAMFCRLRNELNVLDLSNFTKNELVLILALHCNIKHVQFLVVHLGLV